MGPHLHTPAFFNRWAINRTTWECKTHCAKEQQQQRHGDAPYQPADGDHATAHSPTALRIRVCSAPPSSQAVSFSTLKEAVLLSLARSGFTLPRTEPCEYSLVSSKGILEAELLWEGMGLVRRLAPLQRVCK